MQLFYLLWWNVSAETDGESPWLVWIAPPHEPFAPALAQQGIELGRLLVVRPATATEALWAAEQALSSGVCAAVFLWLKGTDDRWLRRLKLAAEAGGALGVLFRPERHRFESSPAALRLLLTQGERAPHLELLKVQGGRPGPVAGDPCRARSCRWAASPQKSRTVKSATADLFAAADAWPAAPARGRARAHTYNDGGIAAKALWYAVVFPRAERGGTAGRRAAAPLPACASGSPRWSVSKCPTPCCWRSEGSVKLFGSLEMLHAGIDTAWRRLKLRAHSATAPSTLAALWFARAGKRVRIEDSGFLAGALAELPVACTSWDAERLHTLRAMGVIRVGELLRLPRAGMARRFGRAAVLEIDIALARQDAPRRAFVPRERFCERCDFETEIETVAYLQKALEPLLGRCAQFLRERQAGVLVLELRLRHRARPATRIRVGLAGITSEHRRLRDVLVQKLSRFELAAPILGMELLSGAPQPLSAGSLDAFAALGGAGGRDTAPQLVERLRARLGEEAVYGICSIPGASARGGLAADP